MMILPLLLLIVLLLAGVPVAFSMAFSGFVGVAWMRGFSGAVTILANNAFGEVAHYSLSTVILFILMAQFITESKVAREVFTAAYKWTGNLRGGVAIAGVVANAGFGAMCGSPNAAAAAMTQVIAPEMKRLRYKDSLTGGALACSAMLSGLIPPSTGMVFYGTLTSTSIGKLLIAGILPGLLVMAIYCVIIVGWTIRDPEASAPKMGAIPLKEKLASLKDIWPLLVLLVVVVGSIYSGLATPTESAAMGAFGALLIGLVMKRLSRAAVVKALRDTAKTSGMIFLIIVGANVFGAYLTLSRIPQNMVAFVQNADINRWLVMIAIMAVMLFLGCIMDALAIIMLVVPMVFPLVTALGFDPIWFGVMVTLVTGIGLATPPMGMCVFITSTVGEIPLPAVFKGSMPFIAGGILAMALLMFFPQIALALTAGM